MYLAGLLRHVYVYTKGIALYHQWNASVLPKWREKKNITVTSTSVKIVSSIVSCVLGFPRKTPCLCPVLLILKYGFWQLTHSLITFRSLHIPWACLNFSKCPQNYLRTFYITLWCKNQITNFAHNWIAVRFVGNYLSARQSNHKAIPNIQEFSWRFSAFMEETPVVCGNIG